MKNLPQTRSNDLSATMRPKREKHTYLRVGDKVFHKKFKSWGGGIVMETRASELPGGMCYVRILFQDGKERIFDNNFDSACCCYHTGIILVNRIEI
ncbi:MAG TPA: DUF3553 domain-containing protein [Thermodesulfobacteriota bacterium]|nr:DUF3553 domain-containing protein [Thermodesulfobacteriota bacterium]